MVSSLALRAGPRALRVVRERGLRAEDVDIFPGASGGAKWLSIAGLDRYFFGEFFGAPRTRPMHLIGSPIGSWRMACLAQRDPLAALARGHNGYIYNQRYSPKPSPREVTEVLTKILDDLLGENGVDEILTHPWAKVHVITALGTGFAANDRKWSLITALAIAATANFVSRRYLSLQMKRYVFHSAGSDTPFLHLSDLPTTHLPLTRDNLRAVLLASGSIPLVLQGVTIPGREGELHWDGGVVDYHLDLDFGAGDGIVLYPHFFDHIVPGWFDKAIKWRRGTAVNFDRVLLVAPSAEFVQSLPGGKIPDRRDFYSMPESERIKRWAKVNEMSERLGDEMRELVATGKLADRVQPWSGMQPAG
ncbi:MAG TPA: patatin-like phospholipase family protein [Gemmatimonadaceae bacterium]|nr:patatin-like phospholipase family protein [Gemmatimonadaceae bacterium]